VGAPWFYPGGVSGFATVIYLIALVPIVIGAMLLFLAIGLVLLLGIGDRQTAKTLLTLPVSRCASLTNPRVRLPRSAAIRGRPVETVVAPLSTQPCAWYRVSVIQTIERGGDEADEWIYLWTHQSDSGLMINDGTGTVQLSPELLHQELRHPGSSRPVTRSPWTDANGARGCHSGSPRPDPDRRVQRPTPQERMGSGDDRLGGWPDHSHWCPSAGGRRAVLEPWLGFSGVTMSSFEELRRRKVDESRDTWSMSRGMATWGIVLSGIGWILYLVSMSLGQW
jgi:hypothetical protein